MEGADAALNRASPSVSLVSKRVLATPVSVPLSATAPQTSPESADAVGDAGGALSRTPEVAAAEPHVISPHWLRHDMRYHPVMTPPTSADPEQMITPDAGQTFTHSDSLDTRLVPNYDMHFGSLDGAYQFYQAYAMHAGFPIKKNRKRGTGQEFCCSFEGKHKPKNEADRKTSKTSKRNGCKAMVLARMTDGGSRAFFTRILLDHNHKFMPTPRMRKRMRARKMKDPAMMQLVDTMHAGHVPHPNVMRVLRSVAGGSENLHFTERDIQNRRAAAVREERVDNIPKLQDFFTQCKAKNLNFTVSSSWMTKMLSKMFSGGMQASKVTTQTTLVL